jgi:hypothetical protein
MLVRRRFASMGWILALAAGVAGCKDRGTPVDTRDHAKTCVPGDQVACACASGETGVQSCGGYGVFQPCQCGGGGAGGGGGGPPTAGTIASGTSPLIDVFVAEAGVLLVTIDAVQLVDRSGAVLGEIAWPRQITSAAFDGTHLVIADAAKMTTLDAALANVAEGDLVQACASSVMSSGNRFVCGPENDWQRVFYTYDVLTATALATSEEYTYNGIPMRRVPGTDDFVTVSVGTSPSDFFLYRVGADSAVTYINESPYHGDFPALQIFAFAGNPATHLVTHEGLMLEIYGPACTFEAGPFDSECFVQDGAVGTLKESERFVGMDTDAAGNLYGFVVPEWSSGSESLCTTGCKAQRLDVATHTVVSEALYATDLGAVVAARHDPTSDALVLGYRLSGSYYHEDDRYPGYRVSILPYE